MRKSLCCLSVLLCAGMILSGCSGGETVDVSAQSGSKAVAMSKILTKEQLAEFDGVSDVATSETAEPTPQPVQTPEPTATPETATSETAGVSVPDFSDDAEPVLSVVAPDMSGSDTGDSDSSGVYTKYRYQKFVVSKANDSNAVFSGESFLTGLDMWREMVDEPEKSELKKYISRDYIGFDSTDQLKLVNRIWIDQSLAPVSGSDNRLSDLFYSVDMSNPSATTEKNKWVSDQTGGYISYTPSNFSENTVMDLMSVVSFSDTWSGGTKPYDSKTRIFYNADGTESKTVMFHDESLTYWQLDNAKAYCMYFSGGAYAMIILPDKDVDPADVNVASLMAGEIPSKKAHVSFYMPEFSTESSYVLTPDDFGLPVGSVSDSVLSGVPDGYTPTFSQVARVNFTHAGAGTVEASDPVVFVDNEDDLDDVSIVCNRPFLYYIGDTENEDVALFGIMNELTDDMVVSEEQAGVGSVSSEG